MAYLPLSKLTTGVPARIEHIRASATLRTALLSLGMMEGLRVRILHVGPFSRDPIAVDIEGHMVAIRRTDAAHIMVDELPDAV